MFFLFFLDMCMKSILGFGHDQTIIILDMNNIYRDHFVGFIFLFELRVFQVEASPNTIPSHVMTTPMLILLLSV